MASFNVSILFETPPYFAVVQTITIDNRCSVLNVNNCQQVRRSESQVLSGFVFLKLKFSEVLILGFIRFYSLLKQSAKLTFTNSMTA